MNYTDEQLKRSLAKMLPEWVIIEHGFLIWNKTDLENGIQKDNQVFNCQLLHFCWLVECSISNFCDYALELRCVMAETGCPINLSPTMAAINATWQQRTIALAKVKGIEI